MAGKITYRLHSLPIPFSDCISVCLSVYLHVCLSLHLAACMSIISIYQCLHWLTIWLTDYTKCTIYFQCHAKLFNLLLANSPKNNFLTHIKALTPWLIDWLIHSMTDWLADGLTDTLAEWLTDRLTASICYRWWFYWFVHAQCTLYTLHRRKSTPCKCTHFNFYPILHSQKCLATSENSLSSSWTENKLPLSSDDNKDNSWETALASCVERAIPRHTSNKGLFSLFENKNNRKWKKWQKE